MSMNDPIISNRLNDELDDDNEDSGYLEPENNGKPLKKKKSLTRTLKKLGSNNSLSSMDLGITKTLKKMKPKRRKSFVAANNAPGLEPASSCVASDISETSNTVPDEAVEAIRYPIPLHTQALIVVLASFFVYNLPTMASLDEVATIETFTNVLFPSLPLTAVIMVRLAMSTVMLGNAMSVFLYGEWYADTDYLPGSKLTVAKRIPFKGAFTPEGSFLSGLRCISTFTLWCWIVEGTAFFLAAMIPLFHHLPGCTVNPWIMRIAMVLWETAAPVSILVSAVVKYALWPIAMEHGENVKLLKAPGALLQHNLNSIACLVEVGLLGGLPVRLSDFAFPPIYGIIYLLFTYAMMYNWGHDKKLGPQFVYPFFDTTLGYITSLSLVILLGVLSLSFYIFCGMEHVLTEADKFIAIVPAAAIVLLGMSVCRVKD